MKRSALLIIVTILGLLISVSYVLAQNNSSAVIGGGVGSIEYDKKVEKLRDEIDKQLLESDRSSTVSTSIDPAEIIGIYDLDSWTVVFENGSVLRSEDFQFVGDMAITPNNTMWQRINITGFSVAVASGTYVLSGNRFTVINDLISATTILNLSWDGTYLTTVTYVTFLSPSFTETDVWRKITMSTPDPSDQDKDGVIDEWDNCPNTPPNSCVDENGCPVQTSKAKTNPAIHLLLDDE